MGQSQPPGQLALSSALTKAYQATDSPGTFLKPSHTEGDAVTTTGVLWSQARQPRENQPPHQSAGSRPSCSTLAPLLASYAFGKAPIPIAPLPTALIFLSVGLRVLWWLASAGGGTMSPGAL